MDCKLWVAGLPVRMKRRPEGPQGAFVDLISYNRILILMMFIPYWVYPKKEIPPNNQYADKPNRLSSFPE